MPPHHQSSVDRKHSAGPKLERKDRLLVVVLAEDVQTFFFFLVFPTSISHRMSSTYGGHVVEIQSVTSTEQRIIGFNTASLNLEVHEKIRKGTPKKIELWRKKCNFIYLKWFVISELFIKIGLPSNINIMIKTNKYFQIFHNQTHLQTIIYLV